MHEKKITKALLTLICGTCLFFIISEKWIGENGERWRLVVDSDGRGYYAYLPAIFIYHDLNFDFVQRSESTVYGKGMADYLFFSSGQRGNRYFVGVAILLTPFFLMAWAISWLTGNSLNGYNEIFFGSVSIAALFYLLLALIFIVKLLRLYNVRETLIQAILILLVFGTNVFHYSVYEPSMSHVYSFATVSFYLFYLKKYQLEKKPLFLYLSALGLGIIILIRPVNALIILSIPFLMGSYVGFKTFIAELVSKKKLLLKCGIIFTSIVFIQLTIFYITYGSFFYWTYRGEGFDFTHPHFIDTLFSYRKGLFIYTPLMFLSVLFIIPYFKKSVFSSVCFILFFLILNYILSSWSSWFYGGSLGLRAFLEFYPLLIIPFAVGINEIKKASVIIITSVFLVSIVILSIIQTYQYEQKIIHFVNMDKEKYWKVFLHTDRKYKFLSYPITNDTSEVTGIIFKNSFLNDFEGATDWGGSNTITTEEHFSGNHCVKIEIPNSYSPGFTMSGKEILKDNISFAKIQLMTKSRSRNNESLLVVSFEFENNKIYGYNTYPLNTGTEASGDWQPVKYGIEFPVIHEKDVMKIYVWNDAKYPIYIDDLKIDLFSEK